MYRTLVERKASAACFLLMGFLSIQTQGIRQKDSRPEPCANVPRWTAGVSFTCRLASSSSIFSASYINFASRYCVRARMWVCELVYFIGHDGYCSLVQVPTFGECLEGMRCVECTGTRMACHAVVATEKAEALRRYGQSARIVVCWPVHLQTIPQTQWRVTMPALPSCPALTPVGLRCAVICKFLICDKDNYKDLVCGKYIIECYWSPLEERFDFLFYLYNKTSLQLRKAVVWLCFSSFETKPRSFINGCREWISDCSSDNQIAGCQNRGPCCHGRGFAVAQGHFSCRHCACGEVNKLSPLPQAISNVKVCALQILNKCVSAVIPLFWC